MGQVFTYTGGGLPLVLPDGVGFRTADVRHLIMEIHYDNPDMVAGVHDRSGVRLVLAPTAPEQLMGFVQFAGESLSAINR